MKYKRWAKEEIEYLKNNYAIKSSEELCEKLQCKYKTIVSRANSLKLKRNRWTKEEIRILQKKYHEFGPKKLEPILKKSSSTISAKAKTLDLDYKQFWEEKDVEFVRNNFKHLSYNKIADILSRSRSSIEHKVKKLGLAKRGESTLEKDFKNLLDSLKIKYETQVRIGRFRVDFLVNNIAIETYGDYWHCNPQVYTKGPIYEQQKIHAERDKRRVEFLNKAGYKLLVIWEKEFYEDEDKVKMPSSRVTWRIMIRQKR